MVFGGISKEGKSDLYICGSKTAINENTYQTMVKSSIIPMAEKFYTFNKRHQKKWLFL